MGAKLSKKSFLCDKRPQAINRTIVLDQENHLMIVSILRILVVIQNNPVIILLILPPNIFVLGKIKLKDIRLYAFHGCLEEEGIIGSDYLVNLSVHSDLKLASERDRLSDTVDYVQLKAIVTREMAIRSKLLEHVAKRIVDAVLKEIEAVSQVKVSIAKRNPPIGGDVAEVRVILKAKR